MSKKYIVWTLNAAENLVKYTENPTDSEDMWLKQLEFELKDINFDIEFGKRAVRGTHVTNIMPDDEYFVPIAVKTIGQYFDKPPVGSDTGIINNIQNYYKADGQEDYKFFWSDECGKIYDSSKMITDQYMGYYEFLLNNGTNHILIGYSQGGLVARYLAYLDEYVFKNKIIKGIITISSPNYGSPLGNSDNQNDIIKKIIEALYMFLSFYKSNFSDLIYWSQNKINFSDIIMILNMMIKGARSLTDIKKESRENFIYFIMTIKKWLGGLSNDINNAFYDLKIFRMDDAYSVLNLVNNNDLHNIFYGGIISTDNDLERMIESFIEESFAPILQGLITSILHNTKFQMLDRTFIENVSCISEIYKKEIMKEYTQSTSQTIKDIIKVYDNGLHNLSKRSHDFVIPSSYQLLCKGKNLDKCFMPDKNFLGNQLNSRANHNTGKSLCFEGGKINFKFIKQYIRKIIIMDN